jgi:hypothetical protein
VQETPPNATHWSRTTMAEAVGISPSSVGRISTCQNGQSVGFVNAVALVHELIEARGEHRLLRLQKANGTP